MPSWCRTIFRHCGLTFIVGTDAQSLSVSILADYSLSLDARLNIHAALLLRNLRVCQRILIRRQEAVFVSFPKGPSTEMEGNN